MKKVLKIVGACLLICGVIALIVCMCAIPNETKAFFDVVVEYLDKPIVLCGVSITIGGVLLFFIVRYILNNTSVGKKLLNELQEGLKKEKQLREDDFSYLSVKYHNLDDIRVKDYDDLCDKYEELKEILKLIPNKKVQEALNNGEETKND